MNNWQPMGRHRYRRERDVLLLETHGEILLPDMQQLVSQLEALFGEHGHGLLLSDIHGGLSIGVAARRLVLEGFLKDHADHFLNAVVGATTLSRGLIALFLGALRMLFKKTTNVQFFDTEAEALSWLTAQGQRLNAQQKRRGQSP